VAQGRPYSSVDKQIVASQPSPPGWQNLIGKSDLVFVHAPLAEARISLGEKNDVWINIVPGSQCIKYRNAIGRNDFSKNHDAPLHAHSR